MSLLAWRSLWGDTGGEAKAEKRSRSNQKFPLTALTSLNNALPNKSLMQIDLS